MARSAAILAKRLNLKSFVGILPPAATQKLKLGGRGFQTVNEALPDDAKLYESCATHKILDNIVRCTSLPLGNQEPGYPRQIQQQSGRGSKMAYKVEDFQNFGKEQYEATVASMNSLTKNYQAIATVYADYSKKSFEDATAFVEKLSGVKSFEKAVELQTEYSKNAYESFVAESKKISELFAGLAKDAYKPFEGYVAKFAPSTTTVN
jgi:hypothetical protein